MQPLWVKLQGNNQPMSAGREYELTCQVYGAHPSPVITWWKEKTKLKNLAKSVSECRGSTNLFSHPRFQPQSRIIMFCFSSSGQRRAKRPRFGSFVLMKKGLIFASASFYFHASPRHPHDDMSCVIALKDNFSRYDALSVAEWWRRILECSLAFFALMNYEY